MKEKICTKKACFSPEVIKRLSLYLRNLVKLREENVKTVSSDEITQFLNVTPSQFRKDLSYFGEFGIRGVGYSVEKLIHKLRDILGIEQKRRIALVGVGRLGSALLGFPGFWEFNIRIAMAFDNDPRKVGKVINGVEVKDIASLEEIIKKEGIKAALICTPAGMAQEAADKLVSGGVKGILNFAPVVLKVPEDVFVSNVDMACELESVIFFLDGRYEKGKD